MLARCSVRLQRAAIRSNGLVLAALASTAAVQRVAAMSAAAGGRSVPSATRAHTEASGGSAAVAVGGAGTGVPPPVSLRGTGPALPRNQSTTAGGARASDIGKPPVGGGDDADWSPPTDTIVSLNYGRFKRLALSGVLDMTPSQLLAALGRASDDVPVECWSVALVTRKTPASGRVMPDGIDALNAVVVQPDQTIASVARLHCTGDRLVILANQFGTPRLTEMAGGSSFVTGEALKAAITSADGTTITLSGPNEWNGLNTNVLYVRHFYEDLWASVLRRCIATDDCDAAVVLGLPGGAKKSFMWYIIHRAVQEGRTVVLSRHYYTSALFRQGRVFDLDNSRLHEYKELLDPRTIYISSGHFPLQPRVPAFKLFITTPKTSSLWPTLAKSQRTKVLALPSFSDAEMMELRSAAFADKPACSEEEARARLVKWGCNVRSVLGRADESWQECIEDSLKAFDVAAVERVIGGVMSVTMRARDSDDEMQAATRLVTKGTLPGATLSTADDDYYQFDHTELATPYILNTVAKMLQRWQPKELFALLHRLCDRQHEEVIRAALLRDIIIAPRFRAGVGKLPLQRLSAAAALSQPDVLKGATLDLRAPLPLVEFTTADDLAAAWASTTGDALFMGPHATFPLVDYVLRLRGQPLLISLSTVVPVDSPAREAAFNALLAAVGLDGTEAEVPLLRFLPSRAAYGFAQLANSGLSGAASAAAHPALTRVAVYKLLLEVPDHTVYDR